MLLKHKSKCSKIENGHMCKNVNTDPINGHMCKNVNTDPIKQF